MALVRTVRNLLGAVVPNSPMFIKELRTSSRRFRSYLLRITYLALLTGFVVLVWRNVVRPGESEGGAATISRMGEAGKKIVSSIMWFQLIASNLVAILLLSTSISDEVHHGTLGVLMTTPMRPFQIVTGKLFSRLMQLLMLIAISFPLLAIVRVFGGVPWAYVVSGLGITLTSCVFAGAATMIFSILFRQAYVSILATLGALVGFYLVSALVLAMTCVGAFLIPFVNPYVALAWCSGMLMSPGSGSQLGMLTVAIVQSAVMLGMSAVVLWICGRLVRKVAMRQAVGGGGVVAPTPGRAFPSPPPFRGVFVPPLGAAIAPPPAIELLPEGPIPLEPDPSGSDAADPATPAEALARMAAEATPPPIVLQPPALAGVSLPPAFPGVPQPPAPPGGYPAHVSAGPPPAPPAAGAYGYRPLRQDEFGARDTLYSPPREEVAAQQHVSDAATPDAAGASVKLREIEGSPILWRELSRPLLKDPTVRNVLLVVGVILLLMLYVFIGALGSLDEGGAQAFFLILYLVPPVFCTLVLAAASIASEKETRCWPLLLTTTLPDRHILAAKIAGVLRRTWLLWLPVIVHPLVFALVLCLRPAAVLHAFLLAVGMLVFTLGLGLYFSTRLRRTTSALVVTFTVMAALWGLLPLTVKLATVVLGEFDNPVVECLYGLSPLVQAIVVSYGGVMPSETPGYLDPQPYRWFVGGSSVAAATLRMFLYSAGYAAVGLLLILRALRRFRRDVF